MFSKLWYIFRFLLTNEAILTLLAEETVRIESKLSYLPKNLLVPSLSCKGSLNNGLKCEAVYY
jgi:hypothetical protein